MDVPNLLISTNIEKSKSLFFKSIDYQNNGQFNQAIECLETAFGLYPSRESIINNLIILYFSLSRKEKLSSFLEKIKINSNTQYYLIGKIYLEYLNKNYEECILKSKAVLKNKSDFFNIQVLDILIKCNFHLGNIKNIFLYSKQILKGKDFYDQRLYAVGNILLNLSKPRAAKWYLNKSCEIDLNARTSLALKFCYLELKDFKNAYKFWNTEYDIYHEDRKLFGHIPNLKKLDDIKNKSVVVWYEQGIGDTLNFSEHVKLLKKYGPKITFVVQDNLLNIFQDFDTDIKISNFQNVKDHKFDFQIALLQIMKLLNCSFEEITSEKSEKNFHQSKVNCIKRVGYAHSGNSLYFRDSYRSIKPDIFEKIFSLSNIEFFKLSKSNEIYIRSYKNVYDLGHLEISDLAKKLHEFDIVITTDTFLVHLCGFYNIKCILLLNFNADWRWFDDKKYTNWYPSVRIIKQKKISQWNPVINTLFRFLKTKSKSTPSF